MQRIRIYSLMFIPKSLRLVNRGIIALIILSGCIFSCISTAKSGKRQANIIFIMSDDHSVEATSAYGKTFLPTPNIDRLAREGMLFKNCFNVVSLCGPSRAAILSGQYSVHNGVKSNQSKFARDQITFPKLLRQAGYQTAIVGKWHLTTEPAGFDYYSVIPGQGKFFDCRMKESGQVWQDGRKGGISHPGYLTDVITDKAIGWLKERDKTKPFCLLVHHKAPHTPYHYPEQYNKLLADAILPEPENFDDSFEGKNWALANNRCSSSKLLFRKRPRWLKEIPIPYEEGSLDYKRYMYQFTMKGYYRLLAAMDENIGRLMDFVDEHDLDENTIVVYTSDNGWFMGDHGLFNKMWMYEESLHVPLIVRYPKEVAPESVSSDFVSVLDFAPTFLDYAGVEKNRQFQGKSIKPLLRGATSKNWRSAHFYHYFGKHEVPPHYGIRTKDYKLIHFYEAKKKPKWELYDIENDAKEMINLANNPQYKDLFREMKTLLHEKKKYYEETKL